ncbi:MAG: hypothetical protein CLLPBCKN_007180 [Chroococcidiopsis cubana SAG 39.79]|uniref:Transposase IS4-like domain-containing protein n=1 Tax=Chroococcidiopsis cubana SAG 39.79 TaxID=388085 RepID=A0AB37URF5_9CYAN|nr:hypothetical protein [Chroococcidiopsis cubana]MDZ4877745.1 hypothetical protein [Chroococcidiopsis cubana SAG 39.79]PSB62825.1 hypothetical protein C7B79_16390 [Chroococcidiopsis cubana CCALA 043]RUT14030.1 hypothetical protein DSM107010_05130 [Chroococcidiopsis cubana SAG 39.79]
MQQLDFQALATAFNDWAQTYSELEPGEWLAMDGKSIKSSVTDYSQAEQNFVSLVSLFSHQRGVVQAVMPMENKLQSEQEVVRLLLAAVEPRGVGITLDALHTQKNT